ncbi:actin-crosslinking protein [Patellaria atrata CBS 101060]|uniref:Actin-crosslinking protein n=1 Tax=Patellaria atrata CBS 101060 TaxID=1346257 RepID=A0A9P4VN23_9PEZI|nr:actin-crosslinking protein [Patellaria atrata CBS 101060]
MPESCYNISPQPTTTDPSDDSWVSAEAPSDISGPVIFTLPSVPPTLLSSDANGTVFSLPIENIIEGDPSTAEPHDVRQVFVANRVAGTEGFSFKSHTGWYLSCDRSGVLSCTREAVGAEESWIVISDADVPGGFHVQSARERFVAVQGEEGKAVEIRGDAETMGFSTTVRIRMQARFKPRLKASRVQKAAEKISRKELEEMVGRTLGDEEVRTLKRARREGDFYEKMLDVKVKGKHDKFA